MNPDRLENGSTPPPPGYEVIEHVGLYYPVRLEGGLNSTRFASQVTCLSPHPRTFAGDGRKVYTFYRMAGQLAFYVADEAYSFLHEWVNLHGGLAPFEHAWERYHAEQERLAAAARPTLNDLLLDTRRLADTYAFMTERFTRFAAGKLTADDLLLIFQHQMRCHQNDAAIHAIYQQALRDFTRTQEAPPQR